MIASWGNWKSYPKPGRRENIEAPIDPGIYEVRHAQTGELFAFGAADNLARGAVAAADRAALADLAVVAAAGRPSCPIWNIACSPPRPAPTPRPRRSG